MKYLIKKQEFLEKLAGYGAGGELIQNGFQFNPLNNKTSNQSNDPSAEMSVLYTILKDLEILAPNKKVINVLT